MIAYFCVSVLCDRCLGEAEGRVGLSEMGGGMLHHPPQVTPPEGWAEVEVRRIDELPDQTPTRYSFVFCGPCLHDWGLK